MNEYHFVDSRNRLRNPRQVSSTYDPDLNFTADNFDMIRNLQNSYIQIPRPIGQWYERPSPERIAKMLFRVPPVLLIYLIYDNGSVPLEKSRRSPCPSRRQIRCAKFESLRVTWVLVSERREREAIMSSFRKSPKRRSRSLEKRKDIRMTNTIFSRNWKIVRERKIRIIFTNE